jgi:molybdopterin converting factor small subunit
LKREREQNERKLIEQNDEATATIKQIRKDFGDEKSRYDAALGNIKVNNTINIKTTDNNINSSSTKRLSRITNKIS